MEYIYHTLLSVHMQLLYCYGHIPFLLSLWFVKIKRNPRKENIRGFLFWMEKTPWPPILRLFELAFLRQSDDGKVVWRATCVVIYSIGLSDRLAFRPWSTEFFRDTDCFKYSINSIRTTSVFIKVCCVFIGRCSYFGYVLFIYPSIDSWSTARYILQMIWMFCTLGNCSYCAIL